MSVVPRSALAALTGAVLLLAVPAGCGPPLAGATGVAGPAALPAVGSTEPVPAAAEPVTAATEPVPPAAVSGRAAAVSPAPHDAGAVDAVVLGGNSTGAGGPGARVARWRWPLAPRPPLLRPFAAPAGPYGPGHRGVDLGAPAGADVAAVEGGVVTHSGVVAGRGTVTVTHADGLASTYEPLDDRVGVGTTVAAGDRLGTLEPAAAVPAGGHCAPRLCLHLGARRGRTYLDPVLLLLGGHVRLLPLWPGQSMTG